MNQKGDHQSNQQNNQVGIEQTIFTKEDRRTEDLHLQLSEKYMVYKELADRCIINPTQIGKKSCYNYLDKGDRRVFYVRPETIFLQEPRLQNQFRNEFIRQIQAPPQPEPFTLMADDLYKQMLDDIRDQSSPYFIREKFSKFYQRRQYKLQHKKHKYLSRWAHFAITSELVDKISLKFSPNYSKVQFDLEQAVKRHQRLSGYDHFDDEPRPQRIEPNGLINPEDVDAQINSKKYSSLRIDDIDIYTRVISFEAACNKPIEKFINRAKWVPLQHRFNVYIQAQERFHECQANQLDSQKNYEQRLITKGMHIIQLRRLEEKGQQDLQQIQNSLRFRQAERMIQSDRDKYIQTKSYDYEDPPMIILNQLDLKLKLEDLCNRFNIKGDMEVDEGNSFSYQVIVQFPTLFFSQVIQNQFAPYDAIPRLQNPSELGRKDLFNVLQANIKKYGKFPAGSSKMEQLEIETQTQNLNIQYINQIERALFGEFNNGQLSDSFPTVRLRKSHWMPYICFKAEIGKEQMMQAALLSGEQNPIDKVAINMLEIINMNDIQSTNLTLESMASIHCEKVKDGKIKIDLKKQNTFDGIFSEQQIQFLRVFNESIKLKSLTEQSKQTQDQQNITAHSLYDTPQHLLFALYLMLNLTARTHKTRLLYTLNAFRSIQKRIALELRELATRDRVNFDVKLVPPTEKDCNQFDFGNKSDNETEQQNTKSGEVKLEVEHIILDEMIDINRYRFKGLTQNQMWSTCPILPKFHVTFGEPIERQEVSTEFEVQKGEDPRRDTAFRLLSRIDFIKEHEASGCILVSDDYGINLMYDCTFADMRVLEQEMLKIMSFYINKIEQIQSTDYRNIIPTVDRLTLVKEILVCEDIYQKAKLNLVFSYLECYEHTCDTLEQQQIIQVIVDLMAKRPRMNFQANHFTDSYKVETKLLETQTKLVKEFIKMQIDNETKQNHEIREQLEKTYRLIYDQMDNKWQYFESGDVQDEKEKRMLLTVGINSEKDIQKIKQLESTKPGMFQAKQPSVSVNQFAEMLGMPVSSLAMLMKDHMERDPQIKISIHENVSFIKLQEGYPHFLSETEINKHNKTQLVPGGCSIGILEVFESLSQIVRVTAAQYHAIQEIKDTHQPDNSLISSLQDLVTMEFLLAELRAVGAEMRGNIVAQSNDLDVIEDSSILGNSEKMLFLIKELVATAQDPELIQNPFVLTKIDIKTIQDYDFDSFKSKRSKVRTNKKLNQTRQVDNDSDDGFNDLQQAKALEQIVAQSQHSDFQSDEGEAGDFAQRQKLHERGKDKNYPRLRIKHVRPNIPSMLEVSCNSVEVLRLRHILVEAYHQRSVLIPIYEAQCKLVGIDSKVLFKQPINFDTHIKGGDGWNDYVDTGPGMQTVVQTELSINEFDPSLVAVLNFADPEAFKALVCPLGLEEFRTVVRYEVLNLQLLVVAVRHNQILLDNIQRQSAELKLFEKGYLVSAPTLDILSNLQGSKLFETDLKRIVIENKKKIHIRLTNYISKISYTIIGKKMRPKLQVEEAYKRVRQSVIDQKFDKVEVSLRYLRTCRMLLCHDYCTDVQSQIFIDTVKLELLNEINQIRRRAYLLNRDSMVHKLPVSRYGEHTYVAYDEESYQIVQDQQTVGPWEFYDGKDITDFYKIPSFNECYQIRTDLEEFQKQNLSQKLYQYSTDTSQQAEERRKLGGNSLMPFLFNLDQQLLVKQQVPVLSILDSNNADQQQQKIGRFADFIQAPKVQNHLAFKYLRYFRNLQNLFDLEFFRCKLQATANSVATLEQSVMSGLPFWEIPKDNQFNYDSDEEHQDETNQLYNKINDRNHKAQQVIYEMAKAKQIKSQLIGELSLIKDYFDTYQQKMINLQLNNDLVQSADFLEDLVQISFYSTLLTLQGVKETQILNGQAQKEIQSIDEVMNLFQHSDESKVTYNNGFHVNTAVTSTSRLSLDNNIFRQDYNSFFCATLPVIDEQGLNPAEFNLIRGMYTANSNEIKFYRQLKPYVGWLPSRDFSFLDMKLLNITREMRKFIALNIKENEDISLQYAHAKLNTDKVSYQYNLATQLEVYNEMKQFSRHQIKSNRLKTVLQILMTKSMLPKDVKALQKLNREFNEIFGWKVINKVDELQRVKNNSKISVNKTQVQAIQQQIRQPQRKTHKSSLFDKFDLFACEIEVYQREIQNYMIMTSKQLIQRETASLAGAFEMNGKRLEVLIDVHQQFAATMDETDKLNHLDIINKISPVQKMLTQIKNRMLPIKTLTGGEGLIIRTKDLSSVLEEFSRTIIKNGEVEMKTRCEFLSSQITSYEDMLYAKDQQILNLEHKLQHAANEMDRVIKAQIFSKGNQMIYENDFNARQLRLVKDNLFTMETMLTEKIRQNFDNDLDRAKRELDEQKKKFAEYQVTLNSHVNADIKQHINELDVELKRLIQRKQTPIDHQRSKSKKQLFKDYSYLLKGQLKQDYKDAVAKGSDFTTGVFKTDDLEEILKEMEKLKESEKNARQDVIEMQNLIRKQRMIQNFKWLVQSKKWEQKFDNMKQQMTSNATLWDQLAESEKREQVLKLELQRSQQEIATQDKLLDRLKFELKSEKFEKNQLLNSKESNNLKITQLESKAKQLEVVSNIDIDRVINTMGNYKRQVDQLKSETKDGQEVITQIYNNQHRQLTRTREKAKNESVIKDQALIKMEQLRQEIQILQSGEMSSLNIWREKAVQFKQQDAKSFTPIKKQIPNKIYMSELNKSHINKTPAIDRQSRSKLLNQFSNQRISLPGISQTTKKKNIFDQLIIDNQLNDKVGSLFKDRSTTFIVGAPLVQDKQIQRKYSTLSQNVEETSENIFSSLMTKQLTAPSSMLQNKTPQSNSVLGYYTNTTKQ